MTKEEAYKRLDLPEGTDLTQVRKQFSAMHSDYRMRIDNAPTPRLRQLFEQQLEEIKEAYALINGSDGVDDTGDLPRTGKTIEDPFSKRTDPVEENLDDAYAYFNLSPKDDRSTVEELTNRKLKELEENISSQTLPAAVAIYQKEYDHAKRMRSLVVQDFDKRERIAREVAQRRENERLEQERITREKAEKERLEQERIAKEKTEKERLEQERIAKEKAEKERLEQERIAKEKAEKERLEQERVAKEKAEKERQEKERLNKEKSQRVDQDKKIPEKEKTDTRQASIGQNQNVQAKTKTKSKRKTLPFVLLAIVLLAGAALFIFKDQLFTGSKIAELEPFEENGLFGYRQGENVKIQPRFVSASAFSDGKAKVSSGDSIFYIDPSGRFLELVSKSGASEKTEGVSNEEQLKDEAAWDIAKAANGAWGYEAYIKQHSNGRHIAEAKEKMAALKKQEAQKAANDKQKEQKPASPTVSAEAMRQYNEDLKWAKNMVSIDGCAGCRENPACKSQVVSRLNKALKANPKGSEARSLLNCLTK